MIKKFFIRCCLFSTLITSHSADAKMQADKEAASLKSDCINVRIGPGEDYPIIYRYRRKRLPIRIIAEFGAWKKVRDKDGDEGWISNNLISNKPTVIIIKNTVLCTKPDAKSTQLAVVESGVVAEVTDQCNNFVKIKLNYKSGWIKEEDTWGIKK